MEFKYINMKEIEFGDKLRISKTLKECEEIELFEIDSIRCIIDYKWEVSCKKFFYMKFCIYMCYMITLYLDCESVQNNHHNNDSLREKDYAFYIRKALCFLC